MASYNRVMLMGNLTRNIELRYTTGGLAVSDMGLAVNDRRKNKDGQWVDDVCFVDVTLFGRTAEVASEYLSKGSPVFIEGRLKYDSWEKDGQKRSKLNVVCERMQMIGGRDGDRSRPASGESGGRSQDDGGSRSDRGSSADRVAEHSADSISGTPANHPKSPGGQAAPTGEGSGYDDADIPF